MEGLYTNLFRFGSTRLDYRYVIYISLIANIGFSIVTILYTWNTYVPCTALDMNIIVLGSICFSQVSYAVIKRISL